MTDRIVPVRAAPSARLGRGTLAILAAAGLVTALGVPGAWAQQAPAAKPATPAQRPAAPRPAAPAQPQQPQQAPQQQTQAPQPEPLPLIYSPWTKVCGKAETAGAKQICFTAKDARLETGMPVVSAALIEPEGEPKKVLRITVPLTMHIPSGTRVIIDQGQPAMSPYLVCFTNGCMADYEVTADTLNKLKKGQQLTIQAIQMNNQAFSVQVPLVDFAKAYDGPPTDPKVLEDQNKKLQDELQKRANEAREQLEKQKGQAPAPGAPAPKP